MKRDKKLGFTLIELTLVLGIAGLVLGGIFAAWAAVTSQNKLRSAEEQLSMIVNQIRTTYGARSALDSASGDAFTNALIEAGLVSPGWIELANSVNVIRNPYGGTLVVTPDPYSGGAANDGINIALSRMTRTDCLKLANDMLGIGGREGLYKIDTTNVSASTTYADISGSVCGSQTVRFYFKLKTGD
jgi:type II secretory pathway pseudopilin PulG